MIVGVGGQGSLLASKLLGYLLLTEGYDVKVSEVHGMSQRGGSVVTYVRFGEKVYSPVIDRGEADFIVSFEKLEAASLMEELAEALEKLSERQRNILILHYYSEIPLNKIADRMGMSYVTVRKSHKTALQKLRQLMENKI